MLMQIFSRTPLYVWAILGVLVYRGVIALRERDIPLKKLFIIPVIMLALSLQDVLARSGGAAMALAAWFAAVAAMTLLGWKGRSAPAPMGTVPGTVRVRGSALPLAMMLGVFFTKYVATVSVAIMPALTQTGWFAPVVCGLSGAFTGYFLGRLAYAVASYQEAHAVQGPDWNKLALPEN